MAVTGGFSETFVGTGTDGPPASTPLSGTISGLTLTKQSPGLPVAPMPVASACRFDHRVNFRQAENVTQNSNMAAARCIRGFNRKHTSETAPPARGLDGIVSATRFIANARASVLEYGP